MRRIEIISYAILLAGLAAMLAVQVPLLHAPLYCDDNFVFSNDVIVHGYNVGSFWIPGSFFAKCWPLFYSVMWVLYRFFGPATAGYHIFAIAVHSLNGFLIFGIARKLGLRFPAVPALLFWLHPVTVEPVSWIFQLLKLLTCALVLAYVLLGDPRLGTKRVGAVACLIASVFLSSFTVFLALADGVTSLLRSGERRARVGGAVLLAAAAYGIFLGANSAADMQNSDRQAEVYEALLAGRPVAVAGQAPRSVDPGLSRASSAKVAAYLGWSGSAALVPLKLAAIGTTAALYAGRILLFPALRRFPQSIPGLPPILFWLAGTAGLLFLAATGYFLYRRDVLGAALLLTFLPVSGLVYFSWFNFSLVADRLIYVALPFAALTLCRALDRFQGRAAKIAWAVACLALLYGSWQRADYLWKVYGAETNLFFPPEP